MMTGQRYAKPHRQTKDADLRTRCQMILLSAAGHAVAEIADLTLFDENTSCTGSTATRRQVSLDWRIALGPGGRPKGDERYQADLQTAVDRDPRQLGAPFSTWTCHDLATTKPSRAHPGQRETVRRYLQTLGYRVVRPVLSIASPDPDYAAKAEQVERLKESPAG